MNQADLTTRRGLTLVELILALSVTAMVALAVSGMLNVVSTGVGSRNDSRTVMVLADAAHRRLGSYINPARCILDTSGAGLVIWFNDARQSDSVHATEIRWIEYDASADTISVTYIEFPDSWTETAKALADREYPSNTDWSTVRSTYDSAGYTSTLTLVDGVTSYALSKNASAALDVRHVVFTLGIQTTQGSQTVQTPASIRLHQKPVL